MAFDFNQTYIFIKIVECGSISNAARNLNMPKATISRKLAQLEESLAIQLVKRTTRKLTLTDAGQSYFQKCQPIMQEMLEANRFVSQLQDEPQGMLRITAPINFADRFLGDIVVDFLRHYPKIQVDMSLSDRLIDLIESNIDLAFRVGKLNDSTYIARRLGGTQQFVVASPDYLQQHGTPKEPKELEAHNVVGYSGSYRSIQFTNQDNHQQTVNVAGRLCVNHLSLMHLACVSGLGISILPTFLCHQDLVDGRLVRILEDWHWNFGDIYAIYPGQRHLSNNVRVFLDFVIERLAEQPWLPKET